MTLRPGCGPCGRAPGAFRPAVGALFRRGKRSLRGMRRPIGLENTSRSTARPAKTASRPPCARSYHHNILWFGNSRAEGRAAAPRALRRGGQAGSVWGKRRRAGAVPPCARAEFFDVFVK